MVGLASRLGAVALAEIGGRRIPVVGVGIVDGKFRKQVHSSLLLRTIQSVGDY